MMMFRQPGQYYAIKHRGEIPLVFLNREIGKIN